jgi:hypothetical protein
MTGCGYFENKSSKAKLSSKLKTGYISISTFDPSYQARESCHERDFEPFKIEHRMADLFGMPEISS